MAEIPGWCIRAFLGAQFDQICWIRIFKFWELNLEGQSPISCVEGPCYTVLICSHQLNPFPGSKSIHTICREREREIQRDPIWSNTQPVVGNIHYNIYTVYRSTVILLRTGLYYQPFPTCSGDTEGACALSADSACWCNPNAFVDGLGGGAKTPDLFELSSTPLLDFCPGIFLLSEIKTVCRSKNSSSVCRSHEPPSRYLACPKTRDIKGPISLQWVFGTNLHVWSLQKQAGMPGLSSNLRKCATLFSHHDCSWRRTGGPKLSVNQ